MSIKLGEMLMEAGLLTRPQLDAALKNQVIFGGKLGTNLIELGYLAEDDLARFLSKKLELPCATNEQLMSIDPEIIKLIPKEVADKYKVIPLGRDRKRLTLAMLDPADLSVIDAISFVTGFYINPLIAPELRLAVALEKHYNIKRDVRYIQLSEKWKDRPTFVKLEESDDQATEDKAAEEPDVFDFSLPREEEVVDIIDVQEVIESAVEPVMVEPAKTEPVEPEPVAAEPVKVELEITKPFEPEPIKTEPMPTEPVKTEPEEFDLDITEAFQTGPVIGEPAIAEPVIAEPVITEPVITEPFIAEPVIAEPVIAEPVRAEIEPVGAAPEVSQPGSEGPLPHTIESFAEELVDAKDREEIAGIITAFLGQEFDRVVLFMIKGTVVDGWKGLFNKSPIPDIENLQIPLDDPSVLKIVNEGKSSYLGPIPDTPANAMMLAGIGGNAPSSALLIPLSIMGRVVAIVYVDGGKVPVSNRLAETQKIIAKAGIAFEILILKNKILN